MKYLSCVFAAAAAMLVAQGSVSAAPDVLRTPGGVTIVRQSDPVLGLTGTEITIQAGLDRETAAQNGLAALVAEAVLQTPEGDVPLQQAVAQLGGSIAYTIDPQDVRFYVEGLPDTYGAQLALVRRALSNPDFSPLTIARARGELENKIFDNEHSALNVGIDMLDSTFYGGTGAGLPPYGLTQTLAGFSGSDARAFYAAHYVRAGAIVSAAGGIDTVPSDVYGSMLDGLAPGGVGVAALPGRASTSVSHELIARRDVPVPWLVAQYPAPQIRSADFGAMLVLTAFLQRTLSDVTGVPGIATLPAAQRGTGTLYNFDSRPANIVVYVDGGGSDPTRAFATALTVVNVLGHAKLQGNLNEMKSFAAGRFLQSAATLQDRAWLAGVFAASGLSPDYAKHVLAAIDRTTASDLQRVARRYLGSPTIALVLPRETQQSALP